MAGRHAAGDPGRRRLRPAAQVGCTIGAVAAAYLPSLLLAGIASVTGFGILRAMDPAADIDDVEFGGVPTARSSRGLRFCQR